MLRALTALLLATGVAAADPAPAPAPAPAKPPAAHAATTCKRVVVGRGLDRHVVCEISAPVVVKQQAPAPKVLIIQEGGKKVTGRPRSPDRLSGLSRRLD